MPDLVERGAADRQVQRRLLRRDCDDDRASRSRHATRAPFAASAIATWTAVVDLPVPPFGSTFAFQLARMGGHDVTVIGRPGSTRLKQLERDGTIVNVRGERAIVKVADAVDERTAWDLVIVTLLAHQVDAVLPNDRADQATDRR